MKRRQIIHPQAVIVILLALGVGACSDDDEDKVTGPTLVTVSGVVRSIDSAEPASGIKVTLLGTSYADEVATGSDGKYSLKVPQGSVLYLHTDDFNPSTDDWFPLINAEGVPVVANADVPDFPIHSCPQTSCDDPLSPTRGGSVAMWDYHLQNFDDANGDRFVPTTSAGSGGIVVWLMGDCNNGSDYSDSMAAVSNDPDFPVAYAADGFFGACPPTEVAYPASRTVSGPFGVAFSFGNPSNADQTIAVEANDGSSAPYRMPRSPVSVPVRPGTITLAWFSTVNGAEGTFKNYACACISSTVFCTP
jgi:hypothetical protein